jgi:hypothetical protein
MSDKITHAKCRALHLGLIHQSSYYGLLAWLGHLIDHEVGDKLPEKAIPFAEWWQGAREVRTMASGLFVRLGWLVGATRGLPGLPVLYVHRSLPCHVGLIATLGASPLGDRWQAYSAEGTTQELQCLCFELGRGLGRAEWYVAEVSPEKG